MPASERRPTAFAEPQRDGDDHVVMVLNWFRELEARMAARKP